MNPTRSAYGDPGHFALVMATGIIAVAASLLQFPVIAWALLTIASASYGVLWLLLGVRAVKDFRGLARDLADMRRGPGFFALVAACGVLGNALVVVASEHDLALALWRLAIVLWVLFVYGFFYGVITRREKPPLREDVHGGSLTIAVATQAISALGTLLAAGEPDGATFLFFALLMHLLGCVFYLGILLPVCYRLIFLPLRPDEFLAPYWINGGGAAISCLAGALLVVHAQEAPFLAQLLPFLKGMMLLFWMVASWWLPLLALLTVWRFAGRHRRLGYDPNYWDVVFPLGMYTACTFELSQAETSFPLLLAIARHFIYLAFAAWVLVFAAMVRRALRGPQLP